MGSTVNRALSCQPKRRRLGHLYGSKEKKAEVKTLEVTVIDYADHDDFAGNDGNIPEVIPDYSIGKDDVLFTGTVDLMTNDKEDAIRSKLVDVFRSRISGLKANDFSFVKVSRKVVSTPACKEGHKWDYPQIKAIKGQEKLYFRLENPLNCEISSLPSQSVPSVASNPASFNVPDESMTSEIIETEQQSTSTHQQINIDDDKDIDALQVMFPTRSVEDLREIRRNNITMQETVDEILGKGMCILHVPSAEFYFSSNSLFLVVYMVLLKYQKIKVIDKLSQFTILAI
jgi:hypothetical protein